MSRLLTHLLDTSVFSQPIRDRPVESVLARWGAVGDFSVCVAALCVADVLQGLLSRDSDVFWRRYRDLLENRYPVLSFDAEAADVYARLFLDLKRVGQMKPMSDLMIAATAKRHGLIVATLNAKHFDGIPGLAVENWAE
jgi:predicted nucleic acid-binding protein